MSIIDKYRTKYISKTSSFIRGAGSVLNLRGSYFNYDKTNFSAEADIQAINSDWNEVAKDIQFALDYYENDKQKQ
jgi:hypothetical protein